MNNLNKYPPRAVLAALVIAVSLPACKTTEPEEPDSERSWEVHGAVDPDSIPDSADSKLSGAEFLELNKKKDGVVVLPSGLQYRILDRGNGVKPELEDSVMVHYKMINLRGDVLDDTRQGGGKLQSFRVAKVIGGWREALVRMKEGARWKLYVPPDLGYGSTGIAGVGANETLIYEIELFQVKKGGPPSAPDLGGDGDVSLDPLD
ncbi:MAG: FKBP-type peptidyl-prolyl cis-trans isomerase FklB [Verrucomicrobiales bacterium]|jgi:FKBP-type peptidyl-prolyl cis-trans isomerase FklB